MADTDVRGGDLSVTALYTAQTWAWAGLSQAELLASVDSRRVFKVTNAVLWIARLFRPRLPSLPHSLVLRHLMIDRTLERLHPAQVLELASGLSRRGAAVSADPSVDYVEVDLPLVAARKRELLGRTEAGRAVLARPNWRLVEGDVTTLDLSALARAGGPRAVIAEGLFMYLRPEAQRDLWRRIRAVLADSLGVLLFDLVPVVEQPKPGLVGRALAWLMKRFTRGQDFERDRRTRADLIRELGAAGFTRVELLEPTTSAIALALPYADVPTQQLVFVCRP